MTSFGMVHLILEERGLEYLLAAKVFPKTIFPKEFRRKKFLLNNLSLF